MYARIDAIDEKVDGLVSQINILKMLILDSGADIESLTKDGGRVELLNMWPESISDKIDAIRR